MIIGTKVCKYIYYYFHFSFRRYKSLLVLHVFVFVLILWSQSTCESLLLCWHRKPFLVLPIISTFSLFYNFIHDMPLEKPSFLILICSNRPVLSKCDSYYSIVVERSQLLFQHIWNRNSNACLIDQKNEYICSLLFLLIYLLILHMSSVWNQRNPSVLTSSGGRCNMVDSNIYKQ